ncbi:hypothetical protein DFR33_10829 [Bradymonas sediminis]|nr:hypothetical protein DFR33_10829 [Bradymonas sediminis]
MIIRPGFEFSRSPAVSVLAGYNFIERSFRIESTLRDLSEGPSYIECAMGTKDERTQTAAEGCDGRRCLGLDAWEL